MKGATAPLSLHPNIIDNCARMYGSSSDEQDDRKQYDHQAGADDEHVSGHMRGCPSASLGGRHMFSLLVGHYVLVTNGTLLEASGANAPRKPMFRGLR